MASYRTFTTTRAFRPDPAALLTAVKTATSDPTAVLALNPDGSFVGKKAAPWSAGDISATQLALDTTAPLTLAAQQQLRYTATSRDKDILAMVALVVRAKGLAAWNAMTTPQKVAATLAEADVWITIRDFLETNA